MLVVSLVVFFEPISTVMYLKQGIILQFVFIKGVNFMQKVTSFHAMHELFNAKMVSFSGWDMPISYGSQIKEHKAVRTDAGMFDVSHMTIIDVMGIDCKKFLQYLISNDVTKLELFGYGKALYSALLTENATIIDDLIVYYMEFGYRLVTNAGTYEKDMAWISKQASKFNVKIKERKDLSILAVQGPMAINKVGMIKMHINERLQQLKPFMAIEDNGWFYAYTGYTGESGLEIMLPNEYALEFWQQLVKNGVIPCGLAARDTLRLEAGMNLYGHDMDENINPLQCNMEWVIDLKDESRDFIGKDTYLKLLSSHEEKYHQVGLVLEGRGVLREGQKLYKSGVEIGIITSGTFSPSLKVSIAIARVDKSITEKAEVDIRDKMEIVKIVQLPFIRKGRSLIAGLEIN